MRFAAGVGWMILTTLFALPASADLISKTYMFKKDTILSIGESNVDGLRIDSIRFSLPATVGGSHMRTGGLPRVEISLSNTGSEARKLGIAVALFDGDGRMVGVASGGSGFSPLKADRQKTYKLVFDDLNRDAFRARRFQISLETK